MVKHKLIIESIFMFNLIFIAGSLIFTSIYTKSYDTSFVNEIIELIM